MMAYPMSTSALSDREITRPIGSGERWRSVASSALSDKYLVAVRHDPVPQREIAHPERDAVGRQVQALRELPLGWDTYSAPVIDPAIVSKVEAFLLNLIEHEIERPAVVPTSVGGVAFEWHRPSREFTIELRPTPSYPKATVYFADTVAGEEWEMDLSDVEPDRLNGAFRRLVVDAPST